MVGYMDLELRRLVYALQIHTDRRSWKEQDEVPWEGICSESYGGTTGRTDSPGQGKSGLQRTRREERMSFNLLH